MHQSTMSHSSYHYNKYGRDGGASGISGSRYDRWVERNSIAPQSTALGKVQKQFWFTKSAVLRKLGRNQDEHIVASDAELDAKMELFKAIEASTKELQVLLAEYQSKVCTLAQEENAMGRMLKDWGRQDKGTANQVMTATGKSISYTAQQRLALRGPLVRLFQEVDTFQSRAIEDTCRTLAQMEKMRTEYRGALMWMKNISQDFNPDQYSQLEKFRQVQEIVRHKKAKFDTLKIKSIQKIDLLAASRCNMFSHALILYQNAIITFSVKTAKTLNSVASTFQGYQHYKFQVIKELAEPAALQNISCDGERSDDKFLFDSEEREDDTSRNSERQSRGSDGNACPRHSLPGNQEKSDSLLNLYEESSENSSTAAEKPCQAPLDLLTNNTEVPDTEKDTQQMLKDLFDSPHRQALPPVYGGDLDSSTAASGSQPPSSSSQTPADNSQRFMPSHLLDYGLLDWGQGVAAGPSIPPKSAHPSPLGQTDGASKSDGSASGPPSSGSKAVDWAKVFQDIDPLSDPASSYFAQKSDGNNAC